MIGLISGRNHHGHNENAEEILNASLRNAHGDGGAADELTVEGNNTQQF